MPVHSDHPAGDYAATAGTLLDNPALGLFFGMGTALKTPEAPGMEHPYSLTLMLAPGEFNKTDAQHRLFVSRVCRYARREHIFAVGGTEGGLAGGNTTSKHLRAMGPRYGFHVTADHRGEWLLVNKELASVVGASFIPVIPGEKNEPGQIGHNPRGIVVNHIKPRVDLGGDVFIGVSHYLTHGQDPESLRGKQNLKLERAIGAWAREVGTGRNIVFHMGDTNLDDKHRNAYTGVPFTSCWDELGKWPITHPHPNGTGPTLDLISSYDHDRRVKCRSAKALTDSVFPLPVDHFSVQAEYVVGTVERKDSNG